MTPKTFQDLPLEIIMTILLMLPVESLLSLMCVSKAWYSLIACGEFIVKHLNSSASRGNRYTLCGPKMVHNLAKPFKLLSDTNPCISLMEEIPCKIDSDCSILISSSGGLVCLTDLNKYGSTIYLWNPFIRKYRSIYSSSIAVNQPDGRFSFLVLGFGYLSETNEHKVVRIAYVDQDACIYQEENNVRDKGFDVSELEVGDENGANTNVHNITGTEVEVYSLSTDNWKKIGVPSFPWFMCDTFSRAFVNNCLHWMVFYRQINEDESMILSFDLENEVFQQIILPDCTIDLSKREEINVYKGFLSYLVIYAIGTNEFCSLWVMNEYGNPESWRNIFNFELNGAVHWPSSIIIDDEIIIETGNNKLCLYNFQNHEIKAIDIHSSESDELDFLPLINSLILLEAKSEFLENNMGHQD